MKRAIFKKFILVLALALIISGSIFSVTMSNVLLDNMRENMLYSLRLVDNFLDYGSDLKPQVNHIKDIVANEHARFTVIDLQGNVKADSNVADSASMENHLGREEVREALKNGSGYAVRISATLKVPLLYVSSMSQNGQYVIRMAIPFSGIMEYAAMLLPAIIISIGISLIISIILASRFSRSVTRPLNDIAEELLKLKEENPEVNFKPYQYEEMNVIADTTKRMADAVNESRKQIEFEKMVRQEFFSNASHELKTPITSIRGYTELLENGMAADEKTRQEFLSRIKKETDNMANLINDILMISRLETKEVEVTIGDVRICPLVNEVINSLEPLAKQCRVKVETNCKPLVMKANDGQLRELFVNLINNAIKYNKPNGKVFVTVTSEANEIVIIIEDTGVGIPEEAKQRVFERFYRVDKGRSRKMGGTGLGLSIVKHVVNYYNGSIEMESKIDIGTKFTVRLPIR